ncbi:unnamed protein product [Cylindrotheca closterium]|uniref:Uncharacterized protein n=1 Tax=Cylindrotheca closterium TaxID=2856 RepID=A0AAD2G5R4_9STRA|nr:unnamed protein product [Cylindrotheca closterium]
MILLDDGLILFFTLTPILAYALLRSPVLPGQRKKLLLPASMATCAIVSLMVKWSSGSSWTTMLDLFLEVLLRFLVLTLVAAFVSLSYFMIKVRRKAASASNTMPEDQPTRVKCIAFHPIEDSWMMLALYSGHAVICKDSNKSVRYAVSPGSAVRACLFASQDDTWIAASDDYMIRVFHHDTGRLLHEFQGHDDYIRSLDVIVLSSGSSLLLSSSDDMTVKVWDMNNSYDCIQTFQGHMHYVMQVCTRPNNDIEDDDDDNGIFATASLDRTIKFWSIDNVDDDQQTESSSCLFTLHGHDDGVNAIDFCHANNDNGNGHCRLLVSASDDLTVRLWNYQTRQQLHVLKGHLENVTAVRFLWNSHCDVGIVSTSEDCAVRFWHCSTTNTNTSTGNIDDDTDEERGQAVKTIQYPSFGRGWALATKRRHCSTIIDDLEDHNQHQQQQQHQVLAVGLDQACMLLNVDSDQSNGTVTVTKETNISEHILETRHVPAVVHSNNIV